MFAARVLQCGSCPRKTREEHHTKPKAWTEGQIEAACRHVESVNPHVALDELVTVFTSPPHSFPEISIATMWNYLDNRSFTVKQATFHNQIQNAPDNPAAREEHASWFLENQQLTFLYIDECGYNINTLRTQTLARIGQRAVVTAAQNKGNYAYILLHAARSARVAQLMMISKWLHVNVKSFIKLQ